jgi:hypothetical protein
MVLILSMVIKLKIELDDFAKTQQYFKQKYSEHGLNIEDFIYICENYILYVIEIL